MTVNDLKRPGLFRLALAGVVFVHHTTRLNLGGAAVDLFFVLSGFWIARMWTGRYSQASTPYAIYLISRAWRILPITILTAGLAWGAAAYRHSIPDDVGPIRQAVSNVLLLGYHSLPYQPNVPAWSLDMEVQFYILAPLLIAMIAWRRWVVIGVVAVSTGAALLGDRWTVAPFLVFFCVGIWAATAEWRPSGRMAGWSLAVGVVAIATVGGGPFNSLLIAGKTHGALYAYMPGAAIVLAIMLIPCALYTVRQADTPTDRMFGDLSFIVYMAHWPILGLINTGSGGMTHRLLMLAVASSALTATSFALWNFYDQPLQRRRAAWVQSRMARSRSPLCWRASAVRP